MNKNLRQKLVSNTIVVILVFINIFLLFVLFRPATHNSSYQKFSLKIRDYPELKEIKNKNWDFQKTAKFFRDLSQKKGGEYGYHALTAALADGTIAPYIDAHLLGHAVGDVLYKQKGIEGIKVCTDDIRNACSHSIVVGYLLDYGENNLAIAVKACEQAPGGRGAYTMCIHGLGHGILAYEKYDMKKASNLCNKTGTKEHNYQEVGQCIGGVTMEMMSGVHDREVWKKVMSKYLKKEEPLAPCSMGFIPKNALGFCYTYLTPHLFELAGANLANPEPEFFGKAMSYCEVLDKKDLNRDRCFASFGKEYVVLANYRNVQSVDEMSDDQLKLVYNWCNSGPKEALAPCLGSALESLYWGGENEPDVSIRFCNTRGDKKEKDKCVTSLISLVSYYIGANQKYNEAFCAKLPYDYRKQCHNRLLNNEK